MSRHDFEVTPARDNLSYDTRLGDEADHAELASASLTKERVDFVHPTDKIRPPAGNLRSGLR